MIDFENKAKELSRDFLDNDKEYRLGFVEAEQSNPKTRELGQTFASNTKDGINILLSVDKDLTKLFKNTLLSADFDDLCNSIFNSLNNGGRIVISGCGSSGRLAMRIEASWRNAIKNLAESVPPLNKYMDSIIALMTGGDYTIIRAVECFEDYIELGMLQAKELSLGENDILVGVTATGETTSILGTAIQALADGAKCFMVVCTDPATILGKFKRVDMVYKHKNTKTLYMPCGGMAVTGSTRMQSSSIEQIIILAALEIVLDKMVSGNKHNSDAFKSNLIKGFETCLDILYDEKNISVMEEQIDTEAQLYANDGHVTYFADEYLLDILADTTERGPTFSLPPFRPQNQRGATLSWAFVKNPTVSTKEAWFNCFGRIPRCIDKSDKEYAALGIPQENIKKIPKINLDALYEYEIGMEPDPEREAGNSLASWIGLDKDSPFKNFEVFSKYKNLTDVTLLTKGYDFVSTRLNIFEHISIKMMINVISTGTMAKIGRVYGNYMVHLNISNKKLVDRATRLISDLCGIDYDTANYQLFLTKLQLEADGSEESCVIKTIEKLNNNF